MGDLKVTFEDGTMVVEGESKTEYAHHRMSKRLALLPADAECEAAVAAAVDGILTILVPKREAAAVTSAPARKTLEINAGQASQIRLRPRRRLSTGATGEKAWGGRVKGGWE